MREGWVLCYDGIDAGREGVREALCTLGNGRFATRGAAEERPADGVHYPGTYLAGGYNTLTSEIAGQRVENEDLVNLPNWLWLTFRTEDGPWFDPWSLELLAYRQWLDLEAGVLHRSIRARDPQGRVTSLKTRRIVHMGDPRLAAIEWCLVAENWSGGVVVRSGIDGSVVNAGVARYRQLASKHLQILSAGPVAPTGIHLLVRTSASHIEVAQAARTRVTTDGRDCAAWRRLIHAHPERIAEDMHVQVATGTPVRIEKTIALCSSRDRGMGEPAREARIAVLEAAGFDTLLDDHGRAWGRLWHRHDVEIDAYEEDPKMPVRDQMVLRLHIFHVLQTTSPHTVDVDAGVPARGLHGEAYRGHVFWDELFIMPLLVQRSPSIARSLMLYRYHRLDAARAIAREAGHVGAAFPWQSAADGREATQRLHLNPVSGRWDPDYSRLQRHVSSAIAHNAWRYWEATGDRMFLEEYGAEMLIEIARYWASVARENEETGRYDIDGVMGPDEYHEKYPDRPSGGLKNNAYTNATAAWCILRALDVLELVGAQRRFELLDSLRLEETELQRWAEVAARICIPFHDGVISQFEGFEELEEFDWHGYRLRYGNIERLDRILKAEGGTPDKYKVSKQPDVLMLFHLFTVDEVQQLFRHLGYALDLEMVARTIKYYQARTSHGSTLSKVVFTSLLHREDCDAASLMFVEALGSDLHDIQRGTTAEGVHLGAMAGTVDIVTRHYAGLALTRQNVTLAPRMPDRIRHIRFRTQWHRRWLVIELWPNRVRIAVDADEPHGVPICIHGVRRMVAAGDVWEMPIDGSCVPS